MARFLADMIDSVMQLLASRADGPALAAVGQG